MSDRPVGEIVDTTEALRPGTVTLEGRFCRVEKLDAARHGAALWQALKGHDDVWDYLAVGPFADEHRASRGGWRSVPSRSIPAPMWWSTVQSGQAVGIVTLMEIRPAMRVVEIGNIVYSPTLQRTALATETQYLVARYAFETLGYRRYEWKCNALNAPSMRAAGRFGFRYEGTFRQHMIVKGRNRDTAWFSMTDGEWPARKVAFEAWLAPENFDEEGRQRQALSALNAETAKQLGSGRT